MSGRAIAKYNLHPCTRPVQTVLKESKQRFWLSQTPAHLTCTPMSLLLSACVSKLFPTLVYPTTATTAFPARRLLACCSSLMRRTYRNKDHMQRLRGSHGAVLWARRQRYAAWQPDTVATPACAQPPAQQAALRLLLQAALNDAAMLSSCLVAVALTCGALAQVQR